MGTFEKNNNNEMKGEKNKQLDHERVLFKIQKPLKEGLNNF